MDIIQKNRSISPTKGVGKFQRMKQEQLLSSSMEKTFRRYQNNPEARHEFCDAEASTYLAYQIRALRIDRGWTQQQLARRLKTTQGVVSRIEDPDYGRITFRTMTALAKIFDVAPVMRFMSTIDLMRERWVIDRAAMIVPTFDSEAENVAFASSAPVVLKPSASVSAVSAAVQFQIPNFPNIVMLKTTSTSVLTSPA